VPSAHLAFLPAVSRIDRQRLVADSGRAPISETQSPTRAAELTSSRRGDGVHVAQARTDPLVGAHRTLAGPNPDTQ
jgi:hypothetical protein